MLLDHMSLPPMYRSSLRTLKQSCWRPESGCLTVPPDGLCLIYCFLAAQDPQQWQMIPRSESGFIEDKQLELSFLQKAKGILHSIVQDMRAHGAASLADALEAGGFPGDEEIKFYCERFQCGILIIPRSTWIWLSRCCTGANLWAWKLCIAAIILNCPGAGCTKKPEKYANVAAEKSSSFTEDSQEKCKSCNLARAKSASHKSRHIPSTKIWSYFQLLFFLVPLIVGREHKPPRTNARTTGVDSKM